MTTSAEALAGEWKVTVKGPTGPMATTLELKYENGVITGTQSGQGQSSDIEGFEFNDGKVSWINNVTKPMKMKTTFNGEVEGDTMSGKVKAGFMGSFPFEGTKVS